ncbi:hypothetical protein PVAND_000109 [Polypedilum vanderplanki]|uniref:Odorant receptor n=1 Tax=Polypedilum vanderplanki TaxID=319348 RepID=A0A9J6BJD7_POLVA|nr:hypothetical protein PVAND_000109 [Polypedilum vanderplanki]
MNTKKFILKSFNLNNFKNPKSFFYFQKFGWKYLGLDFENEKLTKLQINFLAIHCGIPLVYGIFQIIYFIENYKNLLLLADAKDLEEIEINARGNRRASILLGNLAFAVFLTAMFFILLPIFKDCSRLFYGKKRLYLLPFKASFPFNITFSPVYEIIYVLSCDDGIVPITGVTGCDGLFLGICAHLSAQFDIISYRIKSLIQNECDFNKLTEKLSNHENDKLHKKLIELVKLHNKYINLCKVVSNCMWQNIFIYFLCSSIVICILFLVITEFRSVDLMIFMSYLCGYLLQMLSYAISGNMMIEASANVAVSCYDFQWYKCNTKVRRVILMMMIRAQNSANVEIPFFEVSLETFLIIIRAGASYYTLVKSLL